MREALSVGAPGCLHATDWTTYHERRLVTNRSWSGSLDLQDPSRARSCIGVGAQERQQEDAALRKPDVDGNWRRVLLGILGYWAWSHVRSRPPNPSVQHRARGGSCWTCGIQRPATCVSCSQKEMEAGACRPLPLRKAAERRIRGSLQRQRRGRLLRAPTKIIPSGCAVRPYHQKKRRRPNSGAGVGTQPEECDQWPHASPRAARELTRSMGWRPNPGQGLSLRTHLGDAGDNVPSNDEPECNQEPYVEKWVF
jgi:hypothetical protein